MAVVEMTTLKNVSSQTGHTELKADFDWIPQQKGLVLSSYSYGRLLCPLGGYLAGKIGGSTIYSIGYLVKSLITFFTPFLLTTNFNLFLIVYLILGIFESFIFSGVPQIFSRWAPPDERSKFVSFGVVGYYIGSVISFVVSGWVLKKYSWQILFYGGGITSLFWTFIWFFVVKNDPKDDGCISESEMQYIRNELNSCSTEEKLTYPWKQIFTSSALWIASLAEFTTVGGYIFTSVHLPQYIRGNTNITFLHTNLSMALVDMTTIKNISIPGGFHELRAEFNWTSEQKGLILSSYSYGRLFCPIGGVLAGKLGGSTIYSIGNLGLAIITFFSPPLLSTSVTLFIVLYVIFGIFEAFSIAGVPQLISRWAPPNERSKFVAFGDMGFYVGSVISFVVSGCVLKNYRWQILFYGSGLTSFVWFLIWLLVVKNDPEDDKNVKELERKYIQRELNHTDDEKKLVYPWKSIFSFMTLWVAALAEFSIISGYIFTSVFLPQYIKDTKNINIAEIGFTSTIPQIFAIVCLPVVGCLGDYIRSRKIFSITNIHRFFACLSLIPAAIFFSVVAIWSNFIVDMVVISFFQIFSIFLLVDITVLFLDITPKYTAFLMSIVNMFAISSGIIVPAVVGFVVTSHSLIEWNHFFFIFSSMYICVALLYLKFVSGELVSWANTSSDEEA